MSGGPLLPGTVIEGKYRVEGLIGQGGMGAVHAALHLGLGERVAVKFLSGPSAFLPDAREAFRREIAALVRLRHPGVVSILDASEHEGQPYMVMELLHGRTLAQVIAQHQYRLPLGRAALIFDQIFEVLEATHRVGVVHRDLKPDNIFLLDHADRPDRVKVFDFGIAQLTAPGDTSGASAQSVVGTPAYMAPEQCRGLPASPATDIYAAGVMLFDCLTGELPFYADDPADLLAQHVVAPVPKLADKGIKPVVPAGIENLVATMLAKDPHARPSATLVREALAEVLVDVRARADAAAPSREVAATLDREERAPTLPRGLAATPATKTPIAGHAFVWHPDGRRAIELAGKLGASDLPSVPWMDTDLPPDAQGEGAVRIVLVPADAATATRVKLLRAHPVFKTVPVLVIEVAKAETIAELIRAGASDVALRSAGDDEVAKKAVKMARRGR
jgi:hypothetical protein